MFWVCVWAACKNSLTWLNCTETQIGPRTTCGRCWLLHWYQPSWGFPDHTRDSGSGFLPHSCTSAESSSEEDTKTSNAVSSFTLMLRLLDNYTHTVTWHILPSFYKTSQYVLVDRQLFWRGLWRIFCHKMIPDLSVFWHICFYSASVIVQHCI